MNDEVIEMKINEHDKKICELDKRMDETERENAEFKVQLQNLCENLKSLTNIMKLFTTTLASGLVGFFFYAIQKGLFK